MKFSPTFLVDPNIKFDEHQLFYFYIIPLFILSMVVSVWFYFTQAETKHSATSDQTSKLICTKKQKYIQIILNLVFIGLLTTIILVNVSLLPKTKSKGKHQL